MGRILKSILSIYIVGFLVILGVQYLYGAVSSKGGNGSATEASRITTLNFYGFSLGETFDEASDNMDARNLSYFDEATYYKFFGDVFPPFESPFSISQRMTGVCTDLSGEAITDVTTFIRKHTLYVGCSTPGDTNQIRLIFIDDKLVYISAEISDGRSAAALAEIHQKYGANEFNLSNSDTGIELWGKKNKCFSFMEGGWGFGTISPFGFTNKCSGSTLSLIPQKNTDGWVFLNRDKTTSG